MSQHLSLVRVGQMGAIDQATIQAGTPGKELMRRAGSGVWSACVRHLALHSDARVVILCGKGNNGGDGYVAAARAVANGQRVDTFCFAADVDIAGDARIHLDEARAQGVHVETDADPEDDRVSDAIKSADLIIDALLGTGIKGSPRSPYKQVIETVNRSTGQVVAVDVPSGMDADTGEGLFPRANLTVTFGALKPAHVFCPGRSACGRLAVADIGLLDSEVQSRRDAIVSFGVQDPTLPARRGDAHKGDAGRVYVLAGSAGMTGAACLTSLAALRSGAGLVTLGLPKSLNDIAEVKLTEVMTIPLPEVRKRRCLSLRARGWIQDAIERADAIAIGPGIGRHHETSELVRRLLKESRTPITLDADGLNAFENNAGALSETESACVLTPHVGECRRLTGEPVTDPIASARALADTTGSTVLLKGAPTVVTSPDGQCYVNLSGNPGMATAGSGDVLTGLITSLLAQGVDPVRAAVTGAYWHGLAGDLAADRIGQTGLIAGDLVDTLPEAAQAIEAGTSRLRYVDHQP
ncbi:TPA: bifunctional ADP-dependent NAD(P)H-hydrate dehydratase/NAD(P)H-hydrate epimerase [Candidatus Latescibacteria bacterium]|nr:bifunctional ADP-dependent NAD(P)H-hydrate dehydratase/NAD(P)H-hydrate epimerase [Candidatus Latescibacterota bacterium]